MNVERGLLDTNTVILLPRLQELGEVTLPAVPLISAITLAELGVGPLVATNEEVRSARQTQLQKAEASFEALPFDSDAARAYARVASSMRRSGRKGASRNYDAMIAAVAISNKLPLFTCNPEDFAGIDELTVIAVPHPDAGRE